MEGALVEGEMERERERKRRGEESRCGRSGRGCRCG